MKIILIGLISQWRFFLSFLGLMYVIETQKILDLKVNLMASYVIIPQTGFFNGTQNILLLDLGHFQVREKSGQRKNVSKS